MKLELKHLWGIQTCHFLYFYTEVQPLCRHLVSRFRKVFPVLDQVSVLQDGRCFSHFHVQLLTQV